MKNFRYLFILLNLSVLFAQEDNNKVVDSLFREDQFYTTVTYNLLQNTPSDFNQHSLSSGVSFGFLRDMPINKNRTWALALGLGYAYNNIKNNIKIDNTSQQLNYSIDNTFDNNKLVFHELEVPFEIRWRNAAFQSHKFWRIYTGFKASYLFASKSDFSSPTENFKLKNISDLNKLKFGSYLALGNNTVNLYAFYSFTPLFDNVIISNQKLEMNSFKIGLIFYIL